MSSDKSFLAAAWALAATLGTTGAGIAADPPPAVEGIAVEDVQPGMQGYGLSVFRGTAPERFEVEVLGVLRNAQPDESFILARLKGGDLEKTGIIAGMSGSPVYLDGRLAGAVAFTWPFSKEPIAGITPIASMRAISVEPASPASRSAAAAPGFAGPAADWRELVSPSRESDPLGRELERFARWAGSDRQGGMIWSASGFGAAARSRLAAALPALAPLAGGSSTSNPGGEADAAAKLLPGASVAAIFVDGDLRLAATGTVTDRDGDRILAFGHAVTGLGPISMPIAASEVVTVLPSALNSFKLANSGEIVGAFERDHPSGVAGRLGAIARMVPVRLELAGSGAGPSAEARRTFSFRVADVPALVPSLVGIGLIGAWDSTSSFGGGRSVDLDLKVDLAGRAPVAIRQAFDGTGAPNRALGYAVAVLDFLARNEMGPATITGVEIAVACAEENRGAEIVAVRPDRIRAAPGDEIGLQVDLRDWNGAALRWSERMRLPSELPDGRYTLLVGDGASTDAVRMQTAVAPPATLDQMLELLRSLRPASDLVIVGLLPAGGLAVSGELLPRLPGSMRSIWTVSGVKSTTPVRNTVLQHEIRPKERPLAGLVRVELEIRRGIGGIEGGRGE